MIRDPFRLFFPLGIIFAICGTLPWIFQLFGHTFYDIEFHRSLMINGFLFSFVAGFLMTAVPRFTQSEHARKYEVTLVICGILSSALFTFRHQAELSHLAAAFANLTLVAFAAKRFLLRKATPPPTFIFIGVGLILWLMSNILLYFLAPGTPAYQTWHQVFVSGGILSLVLGIGSRLIPAILGWQEVLPTNENTKPHLPFFLAGVFVASYFVPTFFGNWLKFLLVTFVSIKYWRIYKTPFEKSILAKCLWVCSWCMVLGLLLVAISMPEQLIHRIHLLLIGGFSLLTILIATRVILAHGIYGTAQEKTAKTITVITFLIIVGAFTRISAPIIPRLYMNHLSYAALTWLAGILIWCVFVFKHIGKPKQ